MNNISAIFPEKSTSQDLAFLVLAAIGALMVAYATKKGITRLLPVLARMFITEQKDELNYSAPLI